MKTVFALVSCILLGAILTGCNGNPGSPMPGGALPEPYRSTTLQPGDVIQIEFPGAQDLGSSIKIPLNGEVNLPFGGSVNAIGKTPAELEAELIDVFGDQLLVKEANVTLVSSTATVYVSGAVLAPGKIPMERPLTVLEAIMEAGGIDNQRAKMDEVYVIRNNETERQTYRINLKNVFQGDVADPFYLQPFDVVHVTARKFNF